MNFINKLKEYVENKNKTSLLINTLLQAKINLEEKIKINFNNLYKFIKKNDDLSKLKKELDKSEIEEEELIKFKLAQQQANLQTHSDGKSNFYYIYKKSNLEKRKIALINLLNKKVTKQIKEYINNIISSIDREIELISVKLTNFNRTHKIEIDVNKNLNLL